MDVVWIAKSYRGWLCSGRHRSGWVFRKLRSWYGDSLHCYIATSLHRYVGRGTGDFRHVLFLLLRLETREWRLVLK